MKIKKFIIYLFMFLNGRVLAEDYQIHTGVNLLHSCNDLIVSIDNKGKPVSRKEMLNGLSCYSFVNGTIQGYNATFAAIYEIGDPAKIKDKKIKEKLFCLPEGENSTSAEQIIRIVLKDLKNNPNLLNVQAGLLVYISLHNAFPCN